MKHIVLLGGGGYVGLAFQEILERKDIPYTVFSRKDLDYYNPQVLKNALAIVGADTLINAAGYTGKPNVDACEEDKANCLLGNAVLPGIIRTVCEDLKMQWGHVSSGCIYTGRRKDGKGFVETDTPNFDFRSNNCSFYSGTKALGEEVLEGSKDCYIWRLRIPFDERNNPRNYLTKLLSYDRLLDAENSISQRFEFVDACIQCFEKSVPFGVYNVTNPGSLQTREITKILQANGLVNTPLKFFDSEEEFLRVATKTPRSNCVMSSEKLSNVGIQLTDVRESIETSCRNWKP